jgi:hypothetical protein
MISQSVPRPIASVTNGGDNSAGCAYASLGRNCGVGFKAWAPGAATFSNWAAIIPTEITWQTSEPWAS